MAILTVAFCRDMEEVSSVNISHVSGDGNWEEIRIPIFSSTRGWQRAKLKFNYSAISKLIETLWLLIPVKYRSVKTQFKSVMMN